MIAPREDYPTEPQTPRGRPSTVQQVEQDRCDQMIEWLLIALLGFMPFAFGAVEAWSEQIVLWLCAALSGAFLAKLFLRSDSGIRWHWAYIPILVFLLVAVLQLIPLPVSVVRAISPGTAATKGQLLADLSDAGQVLNRMTLSFYRRSTTHDLRLVFAAAAVFFVVTNTYRQPGQIKRLLTAISVIGGIVMFLALAQVVLGNGKIYWFISSPHGVANSGPFVNHSHYAQFANLSIGAIFALMVIRIKEDWWGRKVIMSNVSEYLASRDGKVVLALAGLLILSAATIFTSLSRGGMISMLIAAAFTILVLTWRQSLQGRGWMMVLLALGAFICVLYVGFDQVYDRLATLQDLNRAEGGRWQILKDIALAWTRFPVFGVGLGTHAVVYPMFDRSTIPALASHAENEYAQAIEETGMVGMIALVVFGVLVWAGYVRTIRRTSAPIHFAVYGLGFGLLAVLLHSLSDFGQHLPANGILSAVFCALLVCLSHMNSRVGSASTEASPPEGGRRYGRIALLIGLCAAWMWALSGAGSARRAAAHWAKALDLEKHLTESGWQESDATYADLISSASRAAELEPENITYRHWLNVYRWQSISRLTDPNGQVLLPQMAVESARRIIQELQEAATRCPTFGPTWCVLGQLEHTVLGTQQGMQHVGKSFELAPNDPTVCLVAGLMDVNSGRTKEGLAKLERAVQLDGNLYAEVARICVDNAEAIDLALRLAEGMTYRLTQLADILAETGAQGQVVEEVRGRIVRLLEEKCAQPDAPASCFAALGRIHANRDETESAIQCFREALVRDYAQVSHHLALANLLKAQGNVTEAMHEARICLRLRPEYRPAQRLIEELSLHPSTSALSNGVTP